MTEKNVKLDENTVAQAIQLALAGIMLLRNLGVSFDRIRQLQEVAAQEDRDLSVEEVQGVIDEALENNRNA